MDENEAKELNKENDAREQDIVKDSDANERDNSFEFSEVLKRLETLNSELAGIKEGMAALKNAQAMFVENGAVITDEGAQPPIPKTYNNKGVSFDDIDFSF